MKFLVPEMGNGDGDAASNSSAWTVVDSNPVFNDNSEVIVPPRQVGAEPAADGMRRLLGSTHMSAWFESPTIPGLEILNELGSGGMGVVYRARQIPLNRLVAVKLIRCQAFPDKEQLQRFRAEAEAASRLQHPAIVQVFEAGEWLGRPYIVMELVEGGNLDARIADAPFTPREAATMVAELARAMHFAHERNVIHRDLKPANVLLSAGSGTSKISDFGLARRLDDDSGQTHTGAILGTPSYMAPEQAGGESRTAGRAVDVYALGAILYAMLTGRPPFRAATPLATLEQVQTKEPVPPGDLQPGLPRNLQTICLKCLQKEPERRYGTARELADDLERFLRGEPVVARPVGWTERAIKWSHRRPTAAALLAISVIGACSVVVGLLVHNARLKEQVELTQKKELEAQRQRAQALASFRKGHEAVDDIFNILDRAPGHAIDDGNFRSLYEEQAKAILRYYDEVLRGNDDSDADIRLAKGMIETYSGRMHLRLRKLSVAEHHFLQARQILEPLVVEHPDNTDFRREWSQCRYWQAVLFLTLGRLDEARQGFEEVLESQRGGAEVADRELRLAGLCETRLTDVDFSSGRWVDMKRHAKNALVIWERYAASAVRPEDYRSWHAHALRWHAFAALQLQHWDELEATAARVESVALREEQLLELAADSLHTMHDSSDTLRYVAHGRSVRQDLPGAIRGMTKAIELIQRAVQREPRYYDGRMLLATHYRDRAAFQEAAHQPAEALADWDRAVQQAEGNVRRAFAVECAAAKFRLGSRNEAVGEFESLTAASDLTGDHLIHLILHLTRSMDSIAMVSSNRTVKEDLAGMALSCLKRCRQVGYFKTLDQLRRWQAAPEWALLRKRSEFQDFARDLETELREAGK